MPVMLEVTQSSETANEEIMHELKGRRLKDGRVELWVKESRLKKWAGVGKKAKWHSESVILVLSPENTQKFAQIFQEAAQ